MLLNNTQLIHHIQDHNDKVGVLLNKKSELEREEDIWKKAGLPNTQFKEEEKQYNSKIVKINQTIDSFKRARVYLHKILTGEKGFMGSKDLAKNIDTRHFNLYKKGQVYLKGVEGNSFYLELDNPGASFHEIINCPRFKLIHFLNQTQHQYNQKSMKPFLPWKNGVYSLTQIVLYIPLDNSRTEWVKQVHEYETPIQLIWDSATFHHKKNAQQEIIQSEPQ
tara:strand:+ start:194 stop:856 length:663 start_codon:yes stop_codon:yes gene_type:complete